MRFAMGLLFVALLTAHGSTVRAQGPATYDVRVELDSVSTGSATFSVDEKGNVSGSMRIDTPNVVEAKLSGSVKDGVWTFTYPFSMPDANCAGTAAGSAKVSPNAASI